MLFLLLFRIIPLCRCFEVSRSKKVRVGVAILMENDSQHKKAIMRNLGKKGHFWANHLFSTYDYERRKQARNKPKNRAEPKESVLSKSAFGFYVAVAENILWQFKNR